LKTDAAGPPSSPRKRIGRGDRLQFLQDAFAQPLWIALPGFRKLDDLSSDCVTGRINTVSVSQRHKSHFEGNTHETGPDRT
jgi:hypothetical protein